MGHADPESDRPPYTIAIPPPNVTGALHMGHALNNTIQDVLDPVAAGWRATRRSGSAAPTTPASPPRRWSRRRWPPRASHAPELGRDEFVRRVWEWKEEYGGADHRPAQAPRLHASTTARAVHDGRRLRRPCSSGSSWTCYDKGYIYRDRYMVNWDPGLGSAISDLEVEDREVTDTLVQHRLPARRRQRGDRGRHGPARDDARRHRRRGAPRRRALPRTWSGATVMLPLVGREIPIVADEHVEPEFGTGALKVTPGARPQRLRDRPPPRAARRSTSSARTGA